MSGVQPGGGHLGCNPVVNLEEYVKVRLDLEMLKRDHAIAMEALERIATDPCTHEKGKGYLADVCHTCIATDAVVRIWNDRKEKDHERKTQLGQ